MTKSFCILNFLLLLISIAGKAQNKSDAAQSFSFVFISDIHLEPERSATKNFAKAIDVINDINPDFVIAGGDLISNANDQRQGRADSLFDHYIESAKQFKMPVYNLMGNRELFGLSLKNGITPEHPMFGKKMFEAKLGKTYKAFTHKGWKFFLLDDLDVSEPGNYTGYIDLDQILWIKDELNKTDKQTPIVIAVHIPMVTVLTQLEKGGMAQNMDFRALLNTRQVLDLFKGYNLKLVLQGHLHIWEDIYTQKTRFITSGALCGWNWNGPYKGTAPGFLKVDISNDNYTYEYKEYGWKPIQK